MKIDKIKAFIHYDIVGLDLQSLRSAIESNAMVPLPDGSTFTAGFKAILPEQGETLTLDSKGRIFFTYIEQSKSVSSSAFRQKVEKLCTQYQEQNNSCLEVPEEIKEKFELETNATMLAFAPIKTRACTGYIDPVCNRLVLFTSSFALADQILSHLFKIRTNVEDFKIAKPSAHPCLTQLFTSWVKKSETPEPCSLNQRVVINYPEKGKATIQNRHIANEEIAQLVQNGEVCEVGLCLLQKSSQVEETFPVEFSWNEKSVFKAIRYDLLYKKLWEETLYLDEMLQAKALYYLNVELVEEIISSTNTMLESPVSEATFTENQGEVHAN